MFHEPINYLFSKLNKNGIENLFIKKIPKKTKKGVKQLYVSAHFEPAIFYRAKRLMELGKQEQVLPMFIKYNESFNKINQERTENVHTILFDKEKFEKRFENADDNAWLDRLIILYQYNQQRIILKTAEKEKKTGKKKIKKSENMQKSKKNKRC